MATKLDVPDSVATTSRRKPGSKLHWIWYVLAFAAGVAVTLLRG